MLRTAVFLVLLVGCAEPRVPTRAAAAVVQVSIESDHPHVRLEEGTIQEWHPVCLEPCDAPLDANRIYHLAANDLVETDSFVLDPGAVKLHATMGSASERSAATWLIGIGAAQLLVGGVMALGASAMKEDNSFVSTKDVLLLSAGIVAGASLLGLIPGLAMWLHSSSKVEIIPVR